MTKFTILQKILATIGGIFGVGGIIMMFMPEWAGIAQEVSKYVAMASEALAFVCGVWLYNTHDEIMTEEEIKAKENKSVEKKALKEAKAELKKAQEIALKELAEKKIQEVKQENIQIASGSAEITEVK